MPKVVVVGSLMMDLVVQAPRLPAIGESLLCSGFRTSPGGKGANQALAAARLGAEVALIGKTGKDRFGEILREGLRSSGVNTVHITIDETVGTGVAVPVVLESGANAIFAIPQANLELTADEVVRARQAIEAADLVMLQFEVAMEAALAAGRIARAAGVPILLNPAPVAEFPPELLDLADIVVPNEVEAAALVPSAGGGHAEELAALARDDRRAVITLGDAGAIFWDAGRAVLAPPFPVAAVDTVGAGDAFCAALGVALAEGVELAAAVRFANAAGAVAVTRPGAQAAMPSRDEVEALL